MISFARAEILINDPLTSASISCAVQLAVILALRVMSRQRKTKSLSLPYWTDAEFFAHRPNCNHRAGHIGGLLDISGGTARDVVADNLLGNAPGHVTTDDIEHLLAPAIQQISFAGTWLNPETGRADDGDLVERVGVFEQTLTSGWPGFVQAVKRLASLVMGKGCGRFADPSGPLSRASSSWAISTAFLPMRGPRAKRPR